MFTYYRFLFGSAILCGGKAYNVDKLENWNYYNHNQIKNFLDQFSQIITTNYDTIIESISNREISHLHGRFSKDNLFVLSESLGILIGLTRYDIKE